MTDSEVDYYMLASYSDLPKFEKEGWELVYRRKEIKGRSWGERIILRKKNEEKR